MHHEQHTDEQSPARPDEQHTDEKSPKRADEQRAPQPERLTTPQEREGQQLEELDHPPQAEGPREAVEE